jgi:hypothetical protein
MLLVNILVFMYYGNKGTDIIQKGVIYIVSFIDTGMSSIESGVNYPFTKYYNHQDIYMHNNTKIMYVYVYMILPEQRQSHPLHIEVLACNDAMRILMQVRKEFFHHQTN